ncbi:hypothetical protein RF11_01558 [Thelohanellus kitauei]|uniref:Uncharacterized protein n=1 Tax=Thelohanellus kitauei TaxID=669202 RepID=A0A0C2IBZ4_THEKT|nr:hypothetical protein RF11_01558 [Thelohanellus kitauei]
MKISVVAFFILNKLFLEKLKIHIPPEEIQMVLNSIIDEIVCVNQGNTSESLEKIRALYRGIPSEANWENFLAYFKDMWTKKYQIDTCNNFNKMNTEATKTYSFLPSEQMPLWCRSPRGQRQEGDCFASVGLVLTKSEDETLKGTVACGQHRNYVGYKVITVLYRCRFEHLQRPGFTEASVSDRKGWGIIHFLSQVEPSVTPVSRECIEWESEAIASNKEGQGIVPPIVALALK